MPTLKQLLDSRPKMTTIKLPVETYDAIYDCMEETLPEEVSYEDLIVEIDKFIDSACCKQLRTIFSEKGNNGEK